jgi:hypothetical protein
LKKTLTGLLAATMLTLPASAFADSGKTTDTRDCGMGNTIAFTGSTTLWPPNHKYRSFTITATSSIPADMVTLTSTGSDDEVVDGEELNGSGNTANDVTPNPASDSGTGSASTTQSVRGERSGRGDGRTYTIDAMATFGMGTMPCDQKFTITVPHDQRKS